MRYFLPLQSDLNFFLVANKSSAYWCCDNWVGGEPRCFKSHLYTEADAERWVKLMLYHEVTDPPEWVIERAKDIMAEELKSVAPRSLDA